MQTYDQWRRETRICDWIVRGLGIGAFVAFCVMLYWAIKVLRITF